MILYKVKRGEPLILTEADEIETIQFHWEIHDSKLLADSPNSPENETASRSTSKLFWPGSFDCGAETIFVFVTEMAEL